MLFSDRFWGRSFLFVSLFSGVSLAGEFIFGAWGLWQLFVLAFGLWWACGVLAASAFYDMDGEITPDTRSVRPRFEFGVAGVFLIAAIFHIGFYVYEHQGQLWIRNVNLNGDLPFHWHMIKYLSRAPEVWPENNLYGADRLRYAFGVNWLSALLHRHGLPMTTVIVVPLLLSVVAVFQQLWKWAGLWAVVAFFASGGGWLLPITSWPTIWGPGDQLAWKNLFLSILVTQRGFWFALPAGIYWLRFLIEMQKNPWLATPEKWRFIFAIWAFLPFFHLHTFVILTVFGVVTCLWSPLRQDWKSILKQSLAWAWIPLIFIAQSLSFKNTQAAVRFVWNWMSDSMAWTFSWGVNFGPWPVVVIFLALAWGTPLNFRGQKILSGQEGRIFAVWIAFGILFSHLMLAPWNWDQTKILLWVYLGISVAMGQVVARTLPRAAALVLLVVLHLPGLVQFSGGLGPQMGKHAIWAREDLRSVQNLVSMLPVEERVLVAPSPHHPILATGQPLVAGYMGHLWSQGLSTRGLEDFLKTWVRDPSDPSLVSSPFRQLKSRYLLWGPLERQWAGSATPGGDAKGGSKWQEVAKSGDWVLYKSSAWR
jgi:hypothetical protein